MKFMNYYFISMQNIFIKMDKLNDRICHFHLFVENLLHY